MSLWSLMSAILVVSLPSCCLGSLSLLASRAAREAEKKLLVRAMNNAQQVKYQGVTNIIFPLNPKFSTNSIPSTINKINSTPGETRTLFVTSASKFSLTPVELEQGKYKMGMTYGI